MTDPGATDNSFLDALNSYTSSDYTGSSNDNAATTPTTGDNGLLSSPFWSNLLTAGASLGSAALAPAKPVTPVASASSVLGSLASFLPMLLIGGFCLIVGLFLFRKPSRA